MRGLELGSILRQCLLPGPSQPLAKPLLDGWRHEGGGDGHQVCLEQLFGSPAEHIPESFVFTRQRRRRKRARVGVDVQPDAGAVEGVDGMVGPAFDRRDNLDVRARAEFQVDTLLAEMRDEFGVLDAASVVPDPGGGEPAQRFPDALGAEAFAGVGGPEEIPLAGTVVGGDVVVEGEAGYTPIELKKLTFAR